MEILFISRVTIWSVFQNPVTYGDLIFQKSFMGLLLVLCIFIPLYIYTVVMHVSRSHAHMYIVLVS